MANFVVAALNKKNNYLGVMAFADTIERADQELERAVRLADEWTSFKICSSIQELHQHAEEVRKSKELFLEKDLKDALKWLLVGAVIWDAVKKEERCPNQDAIGMFTSFVQARVLYEFYCEREKHSLDDARAADFCDSWEHCSKLYARYRVPLNKRVSHLVYSRQQYAGESGPSGPGHLNRQVPEFARELLRVTKKFIECARPEFKGLAQTALDRSICDAKNAAEGLGVPNPREAVFLMFGLEPEDAAIKQDE